MRYFVISDNTDTQVGLRLAGVEGVLARTREEGLAAIDEALADPTICLLYTSCSAGSMSPPAGNISPKSSIIPPKRCNRKNWRSSL